MTFRSNLTFYLPGNIIGYTLMKKKELIPFNINSIRIMVHLLSHNIVNDDVIEVIRQLELEYFSLLDKNRTMEEGLNFEEKTGLLKYSALYIENILKTASRYSASRSDTDVFNISYIRIDLDDFSLLNNRYGHELGDIVLKKIAAIIRANARPTDYCMRFGGEEFDIILPATSIEGASSYIEKIFEKIHSYKFNNKKQQLSVTVSAGLSTMQLSYRKIKDFDKKNYQKINNQLQTMADNALYDAKNSGKDRFYLYSPDKNYPAIRKEYISKPKITQA